MLYKTIIPCICSLMAFLFIACGSPGEDNVLRSQLKRLDGVLKQAPGFDAEKTRRIDSLQLSLKKLRRTDSLSRWKLYMDIALEYRAFCSDSSAMYYNRAYNFARKCGWASNTIDSRIAMANAQGAAGLFTLAYSSLSDLDTATLSPSQRISYAIAARQLLSYMKDYAKGHSESNSPLLYKGNEYEEYLINHLPADNNYRMFLSAQRLSRNGDLDNARKIAENLLSKIPENSNLYGMAAYLTATIYHALDNDEKYAFYLAEASISDIKAGVKETMALPALAKWLYNKGEVDRAYSYVNASLEDAIASNARMRMGEVASLLPVINDAYRKEMSDSQYKLMVYFVLVIALFIAAGVLLACVFLNMKKASLSNKRLAQQSKLQDSYIGHFLGLYSSYSDRLESMRRLVERKITAGQTDELLKTLKSSKYTATEQDDFFTICDETFLDLYPNFIDNLNKLLKPESRLTHKQGTPLSTEIRIYALIRLGVEESVKIARILHCSTSTIYTYRNRMRGRAINRNTFEDDVMNITNNENTTNIPLFNTPRSTNSGLLSSLHRIKIPKIFR